MAADPKLVKIFEYALNQEQTGKSFFQVSLDRIGYGAAVSAFRRLIEEEDKHIAYITKILEDLKSGAEISASTVKAVTLDPTNYFDDRAKSEFLQQCVEGSMIPDVTVFNTAWLIEKDLSEFYDRMAHQTDGKAQEALAMLARWEKGHEAFFKTFRDKLSDEYALMPWGG